MGIHFTQEQLLEYLNIHTIPYKLYTHTPLFTCEHAEAIVTQLQCPAWVLKIFFLKIVKSISII